MSLALGAAAVAGGEAVKDLYSMLKGLILKRSPHTSIDLLEQAPNSKSRREVVQEELLASGAAHDEAVLAAAHKLMTAIQHDSQTAAAAATLIGVSLKDVETINLRLSDIVSAGHGVQLEGIRATGDIDIRGVRAGEGSDTKKIS